MTIDLYFLDKGGKQTLTHDLNFAKPKYESKHVVAFKNPTPAVLALLAKSGSIPGGDDVNGARKVKEEKKRKRAGQQVDMDKLADGLVKLSEDDLLLVVQMIHDNKTEETYTKNDVEREFLFILTFFNITRHLGRSLMNDVQRASSTSTCTLSQISCYRVSGIL